MAKKTTATKTSTRPARSGRAKKTTQREKPDHAEAPPSRCPRCDSTEREPYYGTITKAISGIDRQTGQVYTHVIWRRTRCRNCGQQRIDRTRENRA